MKKTRIALLALLLLATAPCTGTARDRKQGRESHVQRMLEEKKFHFHIERAEGKYAGERYNVRATGVTVDGNRFRCSLPRFYRAPVNTSIGYANQNLSIDTRNFRYLADTLADGRYVLVVETRDPRCNFTFRVAPSGQASLRVADDKRNVKTYTGYVGRIPSARRATK